MTIPNLMDVEGVAKALCISPHTVRRWAAQKRLRRVKLGSRTLFDPAEVAQFVEQARRVSEVEEEGTAQPQQSPPEVRNGR